MLDQKKQIPTQYIKVYTYMNILYTDIYYNIHSIYRYIPCIYTYIDVYLYIHSIYHTHNSICIVYTYIILIYTSIFAGFLRKRAAEPKRVCKTASA